MAHSDDDGDVQMAQFKERSRPFLVDVVRKSNEYLRILKVNEALMRIADADTSDFQRTRDGCCRVLLTLVKCDIATIYVSIAERVAVCGNALQTIFDVGLEYAGNKKEDGKKSKWEGKDLRDLILNPEKFDTQLKMMLRCAAILQVLHSKLKYKECNFVLRWICHEINFDCVLSYGLLMVPPRTLNVELFFKSDKDLVCIHTCNNSLVEKFFPDAQEFYSFLKQNVGIFDVRACAQELNGRLSEILEKI